MSQDYPPPAYPAQVQGSPYPPQQPQTVQTTVIVTQPLAANSNEVKYNVNPVTVVCQYCHNTVTTSVDYESGLLTYLAAGGLCCFGCVMGCCLIPFCVDGCKDAVHQCPNCKQVTGKFKRVS